MAHQRPATRLLALLELLQAHGRLSGVELAARLEIDGRTLRRYIVALEELGIPILAERGRHGGYGLVAGYKIPPLMFSNEEAVALVLGLQAGRQLGLADSAGALESARAKIERILPDGLKKRVRALGETVALDLPHAAAAGSNAVLMAMSSAAHMQQRVRLRYRSGQQETTQRDFDIYGLAFQGGRWYAVGHCHLRGGLRTLRLDRIDEASLLAARFLRPDNFDVIGHLRSMVAALPRAHAIEVVLDCGLEQAQALVPGWLGLLETCGAATLLLAQADDLDWFARQLAQLTLPMTVRRPAALRSAVRELSRSLLAMADR